jgi:Na+:H+ antiporter, NhaA family
MRLTYLFKDFFDSEKAGGIILLIATIFSLILANSSVHSEYSGFWLSQLGGHSITHWINDGLMTVFFLMIGLELERELYQGELADIRKASLPIFGALGGMLIPAAFYLLLNFGTSTQDGAGIPMATDIAFAVGILSLLGKKVPASLKVFLISMAVIDDLGAILVIAIFYTETLSWTYLAMALGTYAVLLVLNRMKVYQLLPYLIGGILMWYLMLHSGIHATITGVLLAFAIPFNKGRHDAPSTILQHHLHKPVAFILLPLFAAANTGILFGDDLWEELQLSHSLGIAAGLILGKPIGILLFSYLAFRLKWGRLPRDLNWSHILGIGFLGGIGFTMSIFITLLAFDQAELINQSKTAILFSSAISGIIGLLLLHRVFSDRDKKGFKLHLLKR